MELLHQSKGTFYFVLILPNFAHHKVISIDIPFTDGERTGFPINWTPLSSFFWAKNTFFN
jgi:hypothetical protein